MQRLFITQNASGRHAYLPEATAHASRWWNDYDTERLPAGTTAVRCARTKCCCSSARAMRRWKTRQLHRFQLDDTALNPVGLPGRKWQRPLPDVHR